MIVYHAALTWYQHKINSVSSEEMVLNLGSQHSNTHGVLRLELITEARL